MNFTIKINQAKSQLQNKSYKLPLPLKPIVLPSAFKTQVQPSIKPSRTIVKSAKCVQRSPAPECLLFYTYQKEIISPI